MTVHPIRGAAPKAEPREQRPAIERAPRSSGPLSLSAPSGVRLALQRQAGRNVFLHARRAALRIAVLMSADLGTLWVLRALGRPLSSTAPGASLLHAIMNAGYLEGWSPAIALVLGLFLTGNYGQGDRRRDPGRVLTGCALAVALPLWSSLWPQGGVGSAAQYVVLTLLVWLGISTERLLINMAVLQWFGTPTVNSRTLIVANRPVWDRLLRSGLVSREFTVMGRIEMQEPIGADAAGHVRDLPALIHDMQIETILVGNIANPHLDEIAEAAMASGCELLVAAQTLNSPMMLPRVVWRRGRPLIELGAPAIKGRQYALKRMADIAGSLIGLVLLAPLLAVVAVLIKLDSRGPVFFSQRRVGLGGVPFDILKFRTMLCGADAQKADMAHLNASGDPRLFKIKDDPRITRVGRWLRRWSLDELPQLLNVLKGDMSLVGPRPFFESDLALYEAHHFNRLGARPGITGLWQVSGRSEITDFEEVVRLDSHYAREWSLTLDLTILLRTLPAVFRRRGAV